jgi:hypothetical protein
MLDIGPKLAPELAGCWYHGEDKNAKLSRQAVAAGPSAWLAWLRYPMEAKKQAA